MTALSLDVPPDWEAALARAAEARRIVVLGPTDAGKSSFIHALTTRRPELALLDVDPGQKMLGPPGTVSLGRLVPLPVLGRFVFLGSTAIGSFRAVAEAGARLAQEPFVANTAGYVAGPGARLQAMTLEALAPDLAIFIGEAPALATLRALWPNVAIAPAPSAGRKSEGWRRAVRQSALAEALRGSTAYPVPHDALFEPAGPLPLDGPNRPVCAVADAQGEDMALAILFAPDLLSGPPPPRPVRRVRLGRMWAQPSEEGWRLIDRLAPSWQEG